MAVESAEFSHEDEDGITVVTFLSQRLREGKQLGRIKTDLCNLVEGGVSRLVLDFRHVREFNSAFLSVLIALYNKMPAHSRVRAPRDRNWQVFEIAPDRQTAIEAISSDECDRFVLCGLDEYQRELFLVC